MKAAWIVLGVLGAIGLVAMGVVASGITTYNEFVRESEGVDAQARQVDVAYQRAFRLLPRLTNITDRYMENEADVQREVAALRSGISSAQNGSLQTKDAYQEALVNTILLVGARAEAYPELRASGLVADLMTEVTNTENKIAGEKLRYNDLARGYNAHRRECCVPAIVAGMFGFEAKEYIGFADRPNTDEFPEGERL